MIERKFNPDPSHEIPRLRHDGVDPATEATATKVIGAAIEVHRLLGPGYPESVYESAMSIELALRGIVHRRQVAFNIAYKEQVVGQGRVDLLVEDRLIVELKAVEEFAAVHESQVVSYLRANHKRLGLLINFNVARLKDGLTRIVL